MFPTDDTFGSLIEEVILSLQGFGVNKDQMVTLTSEMTDSSTTFEFDETEQISKGIVEIEDEIIWVKSVSGMTATIPPWGRGFKGTVAASHSSGTAVAVNPTWPRSQVGRAIQDTLKGLYPTLFTVGSTEFDITPTQWQYEMPATALKILTVEWKFNAIDGWNRLDAWDLSHSANTTDFPSGVALSLGCMFSAGTRIRVLYAKTPTLFTATTDLFTSTGLPLSSKDVVLLGAAGRMLGWLDIGRLPVQAVEADALDSPRPLGTAAALKDKLRADYQTRLAEEQRALLARYPLMTHFTR